VQWLSLAYIIAKSALEIPSRSQYPHRHIFYFRTSWNHFDLSVNTGIDITSNDGRSVSIWTASYLGELSLFPTCTHQPSYCYPWRSEHPQYNLNLADQAEILMLLSSVTVTLQRFYCLKLTDSWRLWKYVAQTITCCYSSCIFDR